ncbi:hypothetical protein BGX28_000855 [Mortierella sp. GBA30]|nr:hypothetical protein BGX28_000855 [Mortierella sp. GBA30]
MDADRQGTSCLCLPLFWLSSAWRRRSDVGTQSTPQATPRGRTNPPRLSPPDEERAPLPPSNDMFSPYFSDGVERCNIIAKNADSMQRRAITNMDEDINGVMNFIRNSRSALTVLVIANAGLRSRHLRKICDDNEVVSKMRDLRTLDLSNNLLTIEGIEILFKYVLSRCYKIEYLNLSGNKPLEGNALVAHIPQPTLPSNILPCLESWPLLARLVLSHIDFQLVSKIVVLASMTVSLTLRSIHIDNMLPITHATGISQRITSVVPTGLQPIVHHSITTSVPSAQPDIVKQSFYKFCDALKGNMVLKELIVASQQSFWVLAGQELSFRTEDLACDDDEWKEVAVWVDHMIDCFKIRSKRIAAPLTEFHMVGITNFRELHPSGNEEIAIKCETVLLLATTGKIRDS